MGSGKKVKPGRYIISWAQDKTPVHCGFLSSMERYPAQIIIIGGQYKNPTSKWDEQFEDTEYDPQIVPYLLHKRLELCPNLRLYGDVRTQPTAVRPLTGFEVFCGHASGIFGHPKRALEVVPTATRMPRILATTGACTIEHYSESKAGKKGEAHHAIGAIVVEVQADGAYFMRHVAAEDDGSFIDLDVHYTPLGPCPAKPALALTMGDYHAGQEDPAVLAATRALIEAIKPQHVVLHDVLDFKTRNHHDKTLRLAVRKAQTGKDSVEAEVSHAVAALNDVAGWGSHKVLVVRSNHDEALERWLEEARPHGDPLNASYYFSVWARLFEVMQRTGNFPDAFALEAKRIGVAKSVRFLGRNESCKLGGVEYGFHGDKGINGSKGSPHAYARMGVKTVTGHTHTPAIRDGNYTAGVSAALDHGYNLLPSTWLNAHVIQYANGKRCLITVIKGKFRADKPGTTKTSTKRVRKGKAA